MRLSELKQLNENMAQIAMKFDATKLTVDDLIKINEDGAEAGEYGYHQSVYGGWSTDDYQHVYWLLWEDENGNEEAPFAINRMVVGIGMDGTISAMSSGMPDFDEMTKDDAVKKLASLKGKTKA